jgi:uncharacterized protein YutE (UPF0331/DUF86 family)
LSASGGTTDINRIKQSAEFQELVDRLWEKWRGKKVTRDSRGRPNRRSFANFLANVILAAYRARIPDPYKDVDWEHVIDPDLSPSENYGLLEQQLGLRFEERPPIPGETDEDTLRSQIESTELQIRDLDFMIRHGQDERGNRLTPEQIEALRKEKEDLEKYLEALRKQLEEIEAKKPLPTPERGRGAPRRRARPAEEMAPAPQPAPPPAPAPPTPPPAPPVAPTPEEERERLWEAFSIVLAAAGIDPSQYREDFEAEYGRVRNRPYEEKFSDIMRFASDIVRTYRPRPAQPPAATAELQQVLQGLRDAIDRLNRSLIARPPSTPQELLLAMEAELSTVQPSRAVVHDYVSEHKCWAWAPNRNAEGLMRLFGLHYLVISRFKDCVEYWPAYPGGCLWGAQLVDNMVKHGLITDPFATWLKALAAEIDRRYQEEGRAPCR